MSTLDIRIVEPGVSKSAEIQSAVDAMNVNGGGEVWLKSGQYIIDSTVILKPGVTIKGIRPSLEFFKNCPDLGFRFIGGSVLKAANDNVECFAVNTGLYPIQVGGVSLSLHDLAFKGFRKVLTAGAHNQIGLGLSELRSLFVDGKNDAGATVTELAFDLVNPQHVRMDYIKCYSVKRGLRMASNHDGCQPGNSVVIDFYAYLDFGVQPDYGILLEVVDTGGTPRALNAVSFFRPQVNAFGLQKPLQGLNNALFKVKGLPTAPVTSCEFYGLDAEGGSDCAVLLENAFFTHLAIAVVVAAYNNYVLRLINGRNTYAVSMAPDVNVDMDAPSWPSMLVGFAKAPFKDRRPFGLYWDESTRATSLQFDINDHGYQQPETTGYLKSNHLNLADRIDVESNGRTLTPDAGGTIQVPNTSMVFFTLPNAITYEGLTFTFVKTSANAQPVVIQGTGGQTINGQINNSEINAQYDTLTVRAVGGNWIITAKQVAP